MTKPEDLLAAIIADPANDDLRLVFADLLDDCGEGERSEFIRVQCELASLDPYHRSCTGEKCPGCSALRRREYELWGYLPRRDGILAVMKAELPDWALLLPSDNGRWLTHSYPWAWVRRGFIAEVCLSCAEWFAHGPALVRRQPIERVVLVDKRPANDPHNSRWIWSMGRHPIPLPSELPDQFASIAGVTPGAYPWLRYYPTEAAALDALSKAALLFARQTEPATV